MCGCDHGLERQADDQRAEKGAEGAKDRHSSKPRYLYTKIAKPSWIVKYPFPVYTHRDATRLDLRETWRVSILFDLPPAVAARSPFA
jgi:hypothetical protein